MLNMYFVNRMLAPLGEEGLGLVYLDPFIASHLSFSVWCYCVRNNIFPMAIPRSISAGERNLGLGGMAKYASKMLFLIQQRQV